MQAEVRALAKERGAVILAHNYQVPEVQEVADFVGDSLGPLAAGRGHRRGDDRLLRRALHGRDGLDPLARRRPCCCPTPTPAARWPTRSPPPQLRAWKAKHPGAIVVMYVNTTAEVKAETDYCVTSSNAVAVVEHIYREHGEDTEILFGPDMFLGAYVEKTLGPQDARLGRRVPRPRRDPAARHHRDARRPPGRGLPDPPRVRLLDLGHGVRRRRRRRRRGRAHALHGRDARLRARRRAGHARRSWRPRPGCCTRCARLRPDVDFVAANEAASCRYMKMITLPKLRDDAADDVARRSRCPRRSPSAPGCRSSAWSRSASRSRSEPAASRHRSRTSSLARRAGAGRVLLVAPRRSGAASTLAGPPDESPLPDEPEPERAGAGSAGARRDRCRMSQELRAGRACAGRAGAAPDPRRSDEPSRTSRCRTSRRPALEPRRLPRRRSRRRRTGRCGRLAVVAVASSLVRLGSRRPAARAVRARPRRRRDRGARSAAAGAQPRPCGAARTSLRGAAGCESAGAETATGRGALAAWRRRARLRGPPGRGDRGGRRLRAVRRASRSARARRRRRRRSPRPSPPSPARPRRPRRRPAAESSAIRVVQLAARPPRRRAELTSGSGIDGRGGRAQRGARAVHELAHRARR